MTYRNDRTERARLHKLLVVEQNRSCAKCGNYTQREIAHIIPYHQGGSTTEENCHVLCRRCNLAEHPFSKFQLGDRVILNGRTPQLVDLARHTPRRIISIRYDPLKQCNYYLLGSNGRGETKDGQPLDGYRLYEFRSYQMLPYTPRKYGKRKYTMRPDDPRLTPKTRALNSEVKDSGIACNQYPAIILSQQIEANSRE